MEILCVFRGSAKQNGDPAVVVLVNISKADALAVRRKGKVIVRHKELAVGRAILPAVEFHLVAEGRSQVVDDALFGHHADSARFLCRLERFFQSHFSDGFFRSGNGDFRADDVERRLVKIGVNARLGKGTVHDHAVPIPLFILWEGTPDARSGVHSMDLLCVFRGSAEQNGDLAVVVLVNISKADALAVGGKGKVIVRHKELAVGRTILPAVEFHLVAEGRGQVVDDALFGHHADSARFLCRLERFLQSHFGDGFFRDGLRCDFLDGGDYGRFNVTDQSDRVIEHRIVAFLGKGIVRYDAVPILVLVLGESAVPDFGMRRRKLLHVGFIQFDERKHLARICLVHVGKANALTRGSKGKVVIRKEQFAIGRTVLPAVEFHLFAVLLGQVGNDALFGDQALGSRRLRYGDTLGEGTLLLRHHDHGYRFDHRRGCGFRHESRFGRRSRFQFTNAILQGGDLLVLFTKILLQRGVLRLFFLQLIAICAILFGLLLGNGRRLLPFLGSLCKHRQADEPIDSEGKQNAEYYVYGDQRTDARRQKITDHIKLSHC